MRHMSASESLLDKLLTDEPTRKRSTTAMTERGSLWHHTADRLTVMGLQQVVQISAQFDLFLPGLIRLSAGLVQQFQLVRQLIVSLPHLMTQLVHLTSLYWWSSDMVTLPICSAADSHTSRGGWNVRKRSRGEHIGDAIPERVIGKVFAPDPDPSDGRLAHAAAAAVDTHVTSLCL